MVVDFPERQLQVKLTRALRDWVHWSPRCRRYSSASVCGPWWRCQVASARSGGGLGSATVTMVSRRARRSARGRCNREDELGRLAPVDTRKHYVAAQGGHGVVRVAEGARWTDGHDGCSTRCKNRSGDERDERVGARGFGHASPCTPDKTRASRLVRGSLRRGRCRSARAGGRRCCRRRGAARPWAVDSARSAAVDVTLIVWTSAPNRAASALAVGNAPADRAEPSRGTSTCR